MDSETELLWDKLVEDGIATEDELKLVCNICGTSLDSLESVLYAREGYRNLDQYLEATDQIEEEEEEEDDILEIYESYLNGNKKWVVEQIRAIGANEFWTLLDDKIDNGICSGVVKDAMKKTYQAIVFGV